MPATYSFRLTPLAHVLKSIAIAPVLLFSQQALALALVGGETTIGPTMPLNTYELSVGAILNANGATTSQISAVGASTVNLNNTSVSATGSANGVSLVASSANISNNSNITSSSTGLNLGRDTSTNTGSQAQVSDSQISGALRGALVSAASALTLERSTLSGTNATGVGASMFGGKLSATNSTIVGGLNGIQLRPTDALAADNGVVLDQSRVEGLSGAAIAINGAAQTNTEQTHVVVKNGSSLVGGNGAILEVNNGGRADLQVDNSALVGDIIVDANSSASVTLDNNASLTGGLQNVGSLAVNNGAKWVMTGAGDIANLSMNNGGAIQFGSPTDFYKLSVGNLTGTGGLFIMDANFATGQVDTLEVTGNATGNHKVAMGSSGAEPAVAGDIPVIRIASGDATFSLLNGPVDLGAFSYDLTQQSANEWVLNSQTKVISPGTQSVMALFNAAPTVWNAELTTLRTRMGEVRRDQGKSGGWIRAYGNKFNVSASSGLGYEQTQQGLSFGADAPLPIEGGQWIIGLLGGYSQSDLNIGQGTNGTIDSYYLGAYTTWLDPESGYYFDGVIKFNRFQNESDVQLSDGTKTQGDYRNNAVGASLELGRHIALHDGFFIEPYGQLAGVTIQGKHYDLDNGLVAENDKTHSLLGELGATAGRNIDLGEGKVVQPYIRAAYVHEFAKNNEVKVNGNAFNNDLQGSRGKLGAGVSVSLTEKTSMHVDLDYSNGKHIEQPWGVNFGVRHLF
ncbi:TPA: pertactin family autotransporter [Pseudomonas putida]|nr:pertactin family autotransporter [Pseudomonas putida]